MHTDNHNKHIHIVSSYFVAAERDKRMCLLTGLYGTLTRFTATYTEQDDKAYFEGSVYVVKARVSLTTARNSCAVYIYGNNCTQHQMSCHCVSLI